MLLVLVLLLLGLLLQHINNYYYYYHYCQRVLVGTPVREPLFCRRMPAGGGNAEPLCGNP